MFNSYVSLPEGRFCSEFIKDTASFTGNGSDKLSPILGVCFGRCIYAICTHRYLYYLYIYIIVLFIYLFMFIYLFISSKNQRSFGKLLGHKPWAITNDCWMFSKTLATKIQEPIDWRYLPYIFGLFVRPKFPGISPAIHMA